LKGVTSEVFDILALYKLDDDDYYFLFSCLFMCISQQMNIFLQYLLMSVLWCTLFYWADMYCVNWFSVFAVSPGHHVYALCSEKKAGTKLKVVSLSNLNQF